MLKNIKKIIIYFIFILIFNKKIYCRKSERWKKQIRLGNLLLPVSQRPAPLFGFGQLIVEENDLLLYLESRYKTARNPKSKSMARISPQILYGISDMQVLYLVFPQYIFNKKYKDVSHGPSDIIFQVESVLHWNYQYRYLNYSTFVFNITLPTGSAIKKPPTGLGAPSFFFGITMAHLSVDWYIYNSYAIDVPTDSIISKDGKTFYYQAGLGRNLKYSKKWIYCLTFELTGYYSQKNKINSVKDNNSGGNIVYLGPNCWIANKRIAIQPGFQFVITQQLFGKQIKELFRGSILLGYKF